MIIIIIIIIIITFGVDSRQLARDIQPLGSKVKMHPKIK